MGVIMDCDLRLATSVLCCAILSGCECLGSHVRDSSHGTPSDPVEDAARTMRERKIGCLPVDDNGRLVGIITGLDLLDALMRMTGADKPSGRLEVRLADRPGELARLAGFMSGLDLNIHSILTYPEDSEKTRAVLRIGSIEVRLLAEDLRRAGFDVLWPPARPCLP